MLILGAAFMVSLSIMYATKIITMEMHSYKVMHNNHLQSWLRHLDDDQ